MEGTKPLCSVLVITYNQVNYIRDCLEGAVSQKCSFPYQIVVGDDASSDGTVEILKEFQERYPDKVKLLLNENNLGPAGPLAGKYNLLNTLNNCEGKYVAMCEGDDYWIDENKLEKAVSFLEENEDYSLCFHKARYEYIPDPKTYEKKSGPETNPSWDEELSFHVGDAILGLPVNTAANVFRKDTLVPLGKWFESCFGGDKVFIIKPAFQGKIKYFPDEMCVYRVHNHGITSTYKDRVEMLNNHLVTFDNLNLESNFQFQNYITQRQFNILISMLSEAKKIGFGLRVLVTLKLLMKSPRLFSKFLFSRILGN
jgi:glycosyltransferase involved in cell wall biosynthesis